MSSPVVFRAANPADLETLRAIMVAAFDGVSIDQQIEQRFGQIQGRDWQWRKGRHLDADWARDPQGIIVAEQEGVVLGFVSSWMDQEAGIGHIPNLSLIPEARGKGIGRHLLLMAMDRFRVAGLTHAKIETLVQNQIGNRLYGSLGFEVVSRQIHMVADLQAPPAAIEEQGKSEQGKA